MSERVTAAIAASVESGEVSLLCGDENDRDALLGLCDGVDEYEDDLFSFWGRDAETRTRPWTVDLRIAPSASSSPKLWAYGNGSPGCLHDFQSGPYESREQAADAAAEMLEMTDEEHDALLAYDCLHFDDERAREVGAGMVELFEVDADWSCD